VLRRRRQLRNWPSQRWREGRNETAAGAISFWCASG
jgi:hypothetical protein